MAGFGSLVTTLSTCIFYLACQYRGLRWSIVSFWSSRYTWSCCEFYGRVYTNYAPWVLDIAMTACYTSGGSLSWWETGCCPGGHPLFSRISVTVMVLGSDSICGGGGMLKYIQGKIIVKYTRRVIRKSQKDIKNL